MDRFQRFANLKLAMLAILVGCIAAAVVDVIFYLLGISLLVFVISLFLRFRVPTPPVAISPPIVLASMHIIGAALLVSILIAVGLPVKGAE